MQKLLKLFKYDLWACQMLAQSLNEHSLFDGRKKACNNFAHLVATQIIWHRRVANDSDAAGINLWPEADTILNMTKKLITIHKKWREIIGQQDDLHHPVLYHNSKDKRFQTVLSDIVHHVILHGQHHRAQIALMLRRGGISLPATDYIYYLRQNES